MLPQIYYIEGNIGTGKSTVINNLKDLLDPTSNKFIYLFEPVDEWQSIKQNNKDIITYFYENNNNWAFSFQIMAFISRLTQLKEAYKRYNNSIIIVERSVYTDRKIFTEMLYNSGKINAIDYQIYNKWFDNFVDDMPISGIIYLQCNPEISYKRILKRNRKGENISKDYLAQCNKYHDKWFDELPTNCNKIKINCSKNIEDYINKVVKFILKK